MFALIDIDGFFANAHAVFRPELRGGKIVTLTNNDGNIAAATRAALQVGIKKFSPFYQQKALIQKHNIAVFSSNYSFYSDLSARVMNVALRFGEGHIYSIDEVFLDWRKQSKLISNYRDYGHEIRRTIWRETKLPISIGVAPTLTLAKLACRAAKNGLGGERGVFVINDDATHKQCLEMEIGEVWGVGRRLEKRLTALGIGTAGALAKLEPKQARQLWNVELEKTSRELGGEPCKQWDEIRAAKKQIFSTRRTGCPVFCCDELLEAFSMHAAICAKKARQQGSLVKTIYFFAHNNDYQSSVKGIKGVHTFVDPSADTVLITRAVREAVTKIYRDGIGYKKVGIGFVELVPAEHQQLSLFSKDKSNTKLMRAMDALNDNYGRHTAFLANAGTTQTWAMRQDFLSPCYTTRWADLVHVACT